MGFEILFNILASEHFNSITEIQRKTGFRSFEECEEACITANFHVRETRVV